MTNKSNKSQANISIDEIIDTAISNAEARRDLSTQETDSIKGGISKVSTTTGIIKNDPIVMGKIRSEPITMGRIATDNKTILA